MELNSTQDPPIIQPHCLLFRTSSFFIIVLSNYVFALLCFVLYVRNFVRFVVIAVCVRVCVCREHV